MSKPGPRPTHRVEAGERIVLADIDPDQTAGFASKADAAELVKDARKRIRSLQERLYAEDRRSLLVVLQAIDTGGKDGTIKHVFAGVNPLGCQVSSFKVPSVEELEHDFLWRYHQRTPGRGMIAIFNRSHYEDVLVVRVKRARARERCGGHATSMINDFEQLLVAQRRHGGQVLPPHLQGRAEAPPRAPARRSAEAVEVRAWATSRSERCGTTTRPRSRTPSTRRAPTDAPWYVVPANKKWYRNLVVACTVADTLEAMNPQYPAPEPGIDKVVIPD